MNSMQYLPKALFVLLTFSTAHLLVPQSAAYQQRKAQQRAAQQRAQTPPTCCAVGKTATTSIRNQRSAAPARFAALARETAFTMAHDEPLPFVLQSGKGSMISVKAADGTECFGYEVNAANATKPLKNVVFMIHEWWGLNDYIKQEAETLAQELGVTVIALDLYDKNVATSREDASKFMQAVKPERAKTIIKAFAGYVGSQAKIGTVGWCFGGAWSLQSSLLLGKQAAACVIYYGMPETEAAKLKDLNAPVLGIFAKQEKWITPEIVGKFEQAMKLLNKSIEVKMYDAEHAFANPSNPRYNKAFADEAHALTVAFFKNHL
jgi:carboxymethylenebutenolidase